ncbi:MAG TPA: coproporphyrinogen III oxidase [Deltaproteobacteria bacterium]|nr:coproporphyrinogen III oxidase [Deltaproteobacteria bacterium]
MGELARAADHEPWRDGRVATIFFGGGTPSLFAPDSIAEVLAAVRRQWPCSESIAHSRQSTVTSSQSESSRDPRPSTINYQLSTIDSEVETTLEANPGTVTLDTLRAFRAAGINRVSFGAQSFNPRHLARLGRVHDAHQTVEAVHLARQAGVANISLDLMFAVPGQTLPEWEADLERAVSLAPEHLAVYSLTYEEGTTFHAMRRRGELVPVPEDLDLAMFTQAQETLGAAGYRQYEISNFARPGHESRHNVKYWKREGTTGLGPSAHSLLFPGERAPHGLRAANPPSLAEYGKSIREGRLPWTVEQACRYEDAWKESLIFGLRMTDGVDLGDLEQTIGAPPDPLRHAVNELVAGGRLLEENGRLRLPGELLFVSNEVLQRLA